MHEKILVNSDSQLNIQLDTNTAVTVSKPEYTVEKFLDINNDAGDLQTISWNLENWRNDHERIKLNSINSARLESILLAIAATRSPADLDEVIEADVLGYIASAATELLFENKLTIQALSEQVDIQKSAVQDYIYEVYLEIVMRLVGRSTHNNEPLRKHLSEHEHEALAPLMVRLSKLVPRFEDAVNNISDLLLVRLKEVEPLGLLLKESLVKIEQLQVESSNKDRNKDLAAEIQHFTTIRDLALGHISRLLVQQFEYISAGRNDLQFNRLMSNDSLVAMNWQAFIPYSYPMLSDDSPEKHFNNYIVSCQKTVSAWPQLEKTIISLIDAAKHDTQTIADEIDRLPNEDDESYLKRMNEKAQVRWTESQINFQDFIKKLYKEEGANDRAPEVVLIEISRLCGVDLIHADTTLTMSAVNELAANVAIKNILQGKESQVYLGQTHEDVSRKRILICVKEENFVEEWQFMEANQKAYVPLELDQDFTKKNGPINYLSREQYLKFSLLMEALRYLR